MQGETLVHHVAFCERSSADPCGFGVSTHPGRGLRWLNLVNTCPAEEIGGLNQHLGIWLLRVMEFGTQRQCSAIQDMIFLPSCKL